MRAESMSLPPRMSKFTKNMCLQRICASLSFDYCVSSKEYPPKNCCVILYSTLTLALFILLSRMSLPGFLVWNGIIGRVWKCILHASLRGNVDRPSLGQPESRLVLSRAGLAEEYHEENECQPQKLLDDEEGAGVQERDIQLGRPPGVTSSSISIRRLLCDNAACALCERTAMEAAEVVRIQQIAPGIPPLPQPPLPATSYVERSSLPAVSALRDSAPFPPVSSGEPKASCSIWQTPLNHEVLEEKPSHLPTQTALVCRLWGKSAHPQSQPSHDNSESSEDTTDQEEEQEEEEEEEHFLISSAGTSMQAVTSGEESSPSSCLTKSPSCSWKDQTHFRHHKTPLHRQGLEQASCWSDSESSSESQDKGHWDNAILQKQRRHCLSSSWEASAVASSVTLQSPRSAFAAGETAFVSDATRETLEWHMAVKRVQHDLGLPSLLLRSLRAFQPLAPNPTFQPTPESEVVVVTKFQGAFFLSMEVRSQLESHVRKMVHLKRWGLPRRVQRALGHLKMDTQPPVWREQHAFRNKVWARQNGQRESQHSQHTQHIVSAVCGKIVSKHPPSFQTKLRIHVGKKSLEIEQEAFPKRVRDSQKITDPEERKSSLPKVIPPYKSHAQRRNGPSLCLWGKADGVDMNTKRKYIQFLWGLPPTHTHSMTKVGTSSLDLPVAPLKVHATIEFREAETSFLPHYVRQHLEMHVIRKKIQHQWGESRLMQQSVDTFLPAAPAASAPHSFPATCFQVEMKVLTKNSLAFINLEAKRQLENHVKSKIIERRWGIPKRVMESLHKFSLSLIKKPSDSQKTSVSLQEEKGLKKPPSKEVPYLFGKLDVKHSKYSALRRHIAKKAIEIHMEQVDSVFHLFQASGSQMTKQHGLPKIIPSGLKARQPRCQELAFMEEAVLMRIEFNIIHKNVTARFSLPTLYRDSLSRLFKDVTFWPRCPLIPSKGTTFDFTSTETPFLGQGARAELEWHVRRKKLHHIWGMPLHIQKSLRCLFSTVPSMKISGHMDVTVLPVQLSFLSHTIIQELEKNVTKRNICQQWRLPRRVLGSARLLGPEMVRVKNPEDGSKKPRAMVTSSPCRPPVLLKLQPDVLQKLMFHLGKKHMEVRLGAIPALARFSWQCVFLSMKEPLPKLIPSGHRILQKRCHFLPFGHPEDLDHIELSLWRNHLKSLWGLGSHCTEVVRKLMPRAPGLPSRACGFPFSEVKLPFLQEQEREDLELHIRRKRLEHTWDVSALVQRSLGGFVGETPFLLTHWKTPMVHIHIVSQELSFLSQDTHSYLEFHIQGMKQRHQWGLPRRVMESLRVMSPASAAGWRQSPYFLSPSTQAKDGDGTKRDLQERGADFDFSETQTPFLSNKDREGLELHLKKKKMQHEWSLPSLVRRSLESFMHRTPSLHCLQKARIHIQPKTEELFFLPAGVCIFLEQHIQSMKHRQQWHLPKRILQSLRPLGWELEGGIPGDKRTRVHHLLPERSCEKPPEGLDARRTMVSPSSEAHLLLTLNSEAQQKMRILLLRKCVEVQTAAFPALVKQSWLSVSSRQPLPKHVGPHAPPCLRSNFLPFVWREELRQIELAVLRNHFASLWGLGRSYVEATTALMSKLTSKSLSFRDVQVEFLEVQTPFLQEQFRECLEQHVRRKRLEHVWGLPSLVLKSISSCIHSAPSEPNPQKTEIHVRVLQQEPSFLPQSICRCLEFHLQRMQVQRQWRLPQRVLESTRIFLCPESGTQSSGMTRTWYDHWATSKLPVGVGLPELGHDKNLVSKMVPKLQFHLAKKSTEVQLEAVPGVVRHSWPQVTLSSKQHLPKVLRPGFALQRSSSFPFFHSGEAAWIDMGIRRAHLASLWGSGTHCVEAVSGKTECKPFSGHAGLRWTRVEFLEAQTPFLQKHKREVLEAHITKKKIHHAWGFPILIQKSLKAFMQETPQLPLPRKTKVHVHVLRQDPLFLPQKISSHLEFHIQKRNVQRQWGLPKQVLASLKIFLPVKKAPLSFSKDLGDESFERGKEEIGQRWRTVVDAFSSEQKRAMQKHFERKHLQVYQEMEPKLVRQSHEKASGSRKEIGQKWLPNRAETSAFLTPSTTDDLEPSAPNKQWTSEWGLTRKPLEPPSKFISVTHALIPTRKWSACTQKVETPYLQSEQKEALEYHIKKKRLQHEWGLPSVVQRSVRAFAPPLLMPACPSKGRGQEVRILIKEPSFLPASFRKALEDSLKRRIICRQWGLPKRIHNALHIFSPAVGEALGEAKELHETVPVEEGMYLSEENQQATWEMKEPTEEVGRAGSLTSERPETLKQLSFSTGQSDMEGMAVTSRTPPTTKEVEEGAASIGGLQAMENMACKMPQAIEEVVFADESPRDAADGMVMVRSSETSLGIEAASETPLAADEISSVTQMIPGAVASLANAGQSPFPMQHTVEGPPPTDKVSNGGKMPPSLEDTSPLHESLHMAMEKNLLIKSVEKAQQQATEGGNVADHSQAMEEENIPWQQSLPTIEEENSTEPQVPQSTDEENGSRSHSSQATGEDSILQPQTSESIEEEKSQGPKTPQSVEEETLLELQTSQSTEEENNAESQSTEDTEEENSSRLHSSPAAAADEEEDSSLGSQNSLVLKVENTSGLLSLQATEDEDSWSPGATGGRNPPEESTGTTGTVHIPSGCPLGREKELVKDKNFTAQQESQVSGQPPETVNTQEGGGTQAGRGGLQDPEGTSTPVSEIPRAGLSLQHPMTSPLRSKALTSSTGSPPEHTPEPLGAQIPPSHFPSYGGCKPVQGGQFQVPAKANLDPTYDPQKKPPTYQNELKLWVGHGGRIVTWVSSEMPPFSTSPEPPPSMDGGSWQIRTERGMAGTPLPQRRPLPSQPAQKYGVQSYFQKVERSEGSEPLPECSAGERDPQLMATSSTETLDWDKGKTSQKLVSSLQVMVPKRHCSLEFPTHSQQLYNPHPAGEREPPSADCSHVISSPCVCHTAAYQRGLAFPGERDESQEHCPVSSAESTTDVILPRPECTHENLPRPSNTAEHHLLQEANLTQQTLRSFRLPPHVISSCSGNKETLSGMTRQAGKWCWEQRHGLPHQGSACLQDEGEGTPFQLQGHRDHFVDRRWPRSVAGHGGEPRDWVSESLSEVSLGQEHASADLSMNEVSLEKEGHESTWAIEEHQKTSGASFETSGKTSQQLLPLGFSLGDLPAPLSVWFDSEAEDGAAAKEDFKSHPDSHVMVGKNASQLPLNLLEDCHVPTDSQDQFSTECEWERIGDWDSEHVQPTSTASSADEEPVHNLWERPTGGCCPKTIPLFGSQGQDASCSVGQDADNIVCLIGTVLERKLSLNHGMHVWLQSQSRGKVARCEKYKEGTPTVASHEEEMQEMKPLRAVFHLDAEPAVEGSVSERWGKPVQMDEVTHGPTSAPFPQPEPFQRGRRGPSGRPGLSTRPDPSQMTSKGSHIENHGAVRPDLKLPKDRCQSKSPGMKSGTEGVIRQEAHHLDRPAERKHGSQKGAPDSRERRPSTSQGEIGWKEERLSSSREKRLKGEMHAFSGEQWSPAGSQGTPQRRARGSQRREKESTVRVRFKDQLSPLGKERSTEQEDLNILVGEQTQTTVWASQKSSTFFKSFLLKLLHRHDHQTMVGNGPRGQEAYPAAQGQEHLRAHRRGPASTAPLSGRPVSHPSEEQLRSLKGRVLSRRRKLWTPSESDGEPPA